jgi:hypothetical protein
MDRKRADEKTWSRYKVATGDRLTKPQRASVAGTQGDRETRRKIQTINFIEISIEAGILLGGKHDACFVLGLAGIEPMPS